MHEFSLAQNIIEIAEETARQNNLEKISKLILEVGTLSGVELDALDMALQSLQPGTILENTKIEKVITEARSKCRECQNEFTPDDFFCACPACGSFVHEVLQGKELRVKTILAE